jgi:copper(I)-binding protein
VSPVKLRRTLATGAVSLAATAALTACGFNYPTDRINNITSSANYRDGTVNVLNAVVVSKQDDAGTLIATFVNNDPTKAISLSSIKGDGTAVGQVDVKPFPIAPNGLVSLAAQGGIPMTGTFKAGGYVTLTLTFDDGESASFGVPVVTDSAQWAGLDVSKPTATSTPLASSPSSSPSS